MSVGATLGAACIVRDRILLKFDYFLGKLVLFLVAGDAVDSVVDVEKGKSTGPTLNRGKKRQLKTNSGVAWGKLISQCPPVCLLFQLNFFIFHTVKS